jgi:sarcosine oxidase subunit beta
VVTTAHEHPTRLWRTPRPKRAYEVVIVGAGGHGLATAYYLAKQHGITDVAVLDRSYLAGGNVARNTTVVRSNYLWDESAALYEHSLKLWEGLEAELDYDFQFNQRGAVNLVHTEHEAREGFRRIEANRVNGIDSEWLDRDDLAELCPILDLSSKPRYPVLGATLQRRGGTARHDAAAWAFARAADELGVDLIGGCEVEDVLVEDGRVQGVRTADGDIAADRVALATAGRTPILARRAGLRLPLESYPLQALVSELLQPILDVVVMSALVHVYLSQAHKGELVMGSSMDRYTSYTARGSFHVIEAQLSAALELFPIFGRVNVVRTWAGVCDVTPDRSPIVGLTHVDGLYVNCGWGTGGFKATPGIGEVYADTIANDRPHPLAEPFALERFRTGALIDEHGAAGVMH